MFRGFCAAEKTIAFKIYEDCEKIGGNYVVRVSVFFISQPLLGVNALAWFHAIYNMIMGNFHPETYFIPYHMDLPFDVTKYPGYICSMFVRGAGAINYTIIMAAIVAFHIHCCLYIEAFCEQFKLKVKFIDEKVSKAKTKADYDFIRTLFRDAIDFHEKIIEYVFDK